MTVPTRTAPQPFKNNQDILFHPLRNMNSVPVYRSLPLSFDGDRAWDGNDYAGHEERYVFELSQADILEIENAVQYFKDLNLVRGYISPATFPLPELSRRLEAISTQDIHNGRGFSLLRGLNPEFYSNEESVILFAGICSHIGTERCIESGGLALRHIQDVITGSSTLGLANGCGPMEFRTDNNPGEISAFYTISPGNRVPFIASLWRVYNELIRTKPGHLLTLRENWAYEREGLLFCRPPLMIHDGRLMAQLASPLVGSAHSPRPDYLPEVTDEQREALSAVSAVARQFAFPIAQKPGDISFLHNLSILHAKDTIVGGEGAGGNTHVLGLHLRDRRNEWGKPEYLGGGWGSIYEPSPEEQILPLMGDPGTAVGSHRQG